MNEKIKNYYEEMLENLRNKGKNAGYSNGEFMALTAYRHSSQNGSSELECDELPWEEDTADFIKSLRNAGAESIALTQKSTAIIECLHAFQAENCTMELCTISRKNIWGDSEEVKAIRIHIN